MADEKNDKPTNDATEKPVKRETSMADEKNDTPASDATEKPVKRETSWLGGAKQHPPMPLDERSSRPQTARLAAPWRLLLHVGAQTQTTVGIEVKDRIVLGRADPVANFYPDLDLTPYGGQEGGVSRQHAAVLQDSENKALYIEDLGSTNGTRINGFSLEPARRYRLRDGDELELGRVRIVLRFVRSPYQ